MARTIRRREFLTQAGTAGAGFWVAARMNPAFAQDKNSKLNVACVGAGGRAKASVDACRNENVVALCDPDRNTLEKTGKEYPQAKRYTDFRKMFDEVAKSIDAATVGCPDHTHAPASVMAMRLGKHVYCEKPLTHDVWEARVMRQVAAEKKLATQMGNQGTAGESLRRGVEWIQAGAIGEVKEVHIWTNRPVWPQSPQVRRRPPLKAVPAHLDWDAWLGPAPERPFGDGYHPFAWRGWWDFGTGALGDMACHTANLPFMSLKLGAPLTVEAECEELNPETYPGWAKVNYQFPARGNMPAVKVTWYEGKKDGQKLTPPLDLLQGEKISGSGSLLVGSKGSMYSPDDYGGKTLWLPKSQFEGYQGPPRSLPRSPGHHPEWIAACKGGAPALSNFDYAGPMTEFILLGNVAMKAGKKIEWDAENCKAANCPEADPWIKREYRKGWTL